MPSSLCHLRPRLRQVGSATGEKFVLCHLTPGHCEQWCIDLGFGAQEEVHFHLSGKCPVHLTGFFEIDVRRAPPARLATAYSGRTDCHS